MTGTWSSNRTARTTFSSREAALNNSQNRRAVKICCVRDQGVSPRPMPCATLGPRAAAPQKTWETETHTPCIAQGRSELPRG